jgi:hypothetical protein
LKVPAGTVAKASRLSWDRQGDIHDRGGGGNTVLAFLVGAVAVVVAVVGFFMWDNYKAHTGGAQPAQSITLNVKHQ